MVGCLDPVMVPILSKARRHPYLTSIPLRERKREKAREREGKREKEKEKKLLHQYYIINIKNRKYNTHNTKQLISTDSVFIYTC